LFGTRANISTGMIMSTSGKKGNLIHLKEQAPEIYAFQDRFVEHTSYSTTEIREARAPLDSLLQRLRP
jgi:hypothetical protein